MGGRKAKTARKAKGAAARGGRRSRPAAGAASRSRIEASLRRERDLLRRAFATPLVGIIILGPDGKRLFVNDCAIARTGYTREEYLALPVSRFALPDDFQADLDGLRRMVAGEIDHESRVRRFVRKDGTTYWASTSVHCARAPDGSVTHLYFFVTDLSDLKATEAALRESEQRFRTVVESSLEGITVLDLGSMRYTFVSPAQAAMTGFRAEELLAMSASEVLDRVHPEDRHVPEEQLAAIAAGRSEGSNVEYRWKVRNGEYRWLSDSRKAIRDAEGRVVAIVGVTFDVTLRKQAEAERGALQAQLALASRLAAMGTLVAGVAHEINNPLAGDMAGQGVALEIVREVRERLRGEAPLSREAEVRALDEVLEALEEAQECSLRIATIVKELSIFGRSDSRRERVRLVDVVEGARRWLPAAVARNVAITVEAGDAPDVLVARGQLEQVVLNLLSNAARATANGLRNPIVVRTGAGTPGMARLEVVDRGTGIDPAILDRIFEPFFTTRPAGVERGSGLGLAISQAIVAAHQGTLTVESALGRGSTFRVELPATPADG